MSVHGHGVAGDGVGKDSATPAQGIIRHMRQRRV